MSGWKKVILIIVSVFAVIFIVQIVLGFSAFCTLRARNTETIALPAFQQKQSMSNTVNADCDVLWGSDSKTATLSMEMWENGDCTAEAHFDIAADTTELQVIYTIDGFGEDSAEQSVFVQCDFGDSELTGSVMYRFTPAHPVMAFAFTRYDETIKLEADSDVVLAARYLASDSERIDALSCKMLTDDPERIADIPCVILVRLKARGDK